MPTIGYGYEIIRPQYEANLQNVDLIAKVLLSKQGEYDRAYAGMKDLQKQALGISFLNKKEQGKIDSFNKEVADTYASGEFGDLSEGRNAERYYSMFDKIGQDKTLISRYRQDAQYQKMVRDVEAKRMSKDPAKAGFGQIHYENFLHNLGEYSNLDLDSPDAEGFVVKPYTDYIDINKELADRMEDVPVKKFDVIEVKNGYTVTKRYEGRDPNAVGSSVSTYMGTRGASQVREQAEYTFRRAQSDPNFQQAIYSDHVAYNQQAQNSIKTELDKIQEDIRKSQDPAQVQDLAMKQARLEGEMSKLQNNLKSADEFFSRDRDDIVNDITSITLQDIIKGSTDTYGGYSVSEKIEPDRTFIELAKMRQRAEEFGINTQLKVADMQQRGELARAKMASDAGKSTAKVDPQGIPEPSYTSVTDPTAVDFGSTFNALQSSATKLYAQSTNILRDGMTHGDRPMTGEQVTLELLIDDKKFKDNQYYSGNPYFEAFQIARDELYTNDRALAEYIGKRPTDNYSWDRLKEAAAKVQARADQIMNSPKNKTEADLMNRLQDTMANKLSLDEFLEQANKSGNPEQYIKDSPLTQIYPNAVYDLELPENASKEQKARQAQMETVFRPLFENSIDMPGGTYNPEVTALSRVEWEKQYVDPLRVRSVPYGQVRKVESGPDGTLKVFLKDSAFITATKGDEVDLAKSGFMSQSGSYMNVKGPNGKFIDITKEQIQSKGYFELKDERFNKMNFSNQLGYTVGAKPQKRWGASSDGVTVPFEIRKSSINGKVEVSIAGGTFRSYETTDVSAVINQVRTRIAANTYADIVPSAGPTPSASPTPAPQQ